MGSPPTSGRDHTKSTPTIACKSQHISVGIFQRSLQLQCNANGSSGQLHHCTCKWYHMQVMGFWGQARILHRAIACTLLVLQSHLWGHAHSDSLGHSPLPTSHTNNPRAWTTKSSTACAHSQQLLWKISHQTGQMINCMPLRISVPYLRFMQGRQIPLHPARTFNRYQ